MKYCERKKNKKEKTNKGSKVFSLLVICIFLFSLVAGAVDAAAESYVEYDYPSDAGRAVSISSWTDWLANLFKIEQKVPIVIARETTATECSARNGQYLSSVDWQGNTKCLKQKNCALSGTSCSCDTDYVDISYCSGGTQPPVTPSVCTNGAKQCNAAGNSVGICAFNQWAYTSCLSGVCTNGVCGSTPTPTCTYAGKTIEKNWYYCKASGINILWCDTPGTSIPYTDMSCPTGKACEPASTANSISSLCFKTIGGQIEGSKRCTSKHDQWLSTGTKSNVLQFLF